MQWDTSPLEGRKPDISFAFSHQKRKERSQRPTRRPRSSPHSPRWPRCGGWWWPHRPAPALTAHSGSPWLRSDPPWVWKHRRPAAIHHRCHADVWCFGFRCGQSHRLGVKVVQQVVGVAVAVSAHHHQGNEGSQENGGQHPDGHDHHRLHGDSGSHGGWRLQLERRVQSGSSDCLSSSTNGCSPVEAENEKRSPVRISRISAPGKSRPSQWGREGCRRRFQNKHPKLSFEEERQQKHPHKSYLNRSQPGFNPGTDTH